MGTRARSVVCLSSAPRSSSKVSAQLEGRSSPTDKLSSRQESSSSEATHVEAIAHDHLGRPRPHIAATSRKPINARYALITYRRRHKNPASLSRRDQKRLSVKRLSTKCPSSSLCIDKGFDHHRRHHLSADPRMRPYRRDPNASRICRQHSESHVSGSLHPCFRGRCQKRVSLRNAEDKRVAGAIR